MLVDIERIISNLEESNSHLEEKKTSPQKWKVSLLL